MPTFTDLYYTTATHTGNSNLEAELSEAFEVGAKYNHHIVKGAIAVFNMAGKNMIDWVKPSPEALWESTNHTQINKKGVETNISFDFKEWLGDNQPINSFNVGYMYIDQERVEDELISNYTLNHLRHKFTAGLHHDLIKNLTLSWNFRWQERNGSYVKYSDLLPGERVDYAPFSILDVKANYKIRNTDFFVNANNIFNSVHVDLGNIPQPGFWLSGGASVRF